MSLNPTSLECFVSFAFDWALLTFTTQLVWFSVRTLRPFVCILYLFFGPCGMSSILRRGLFMECVWKERGGSRKTLSLRLHLLHPYLDPGSAPDYQIRCIENSELASHVASRWLHSGFHCLWILIGCYNGDVNIFCVVNGGHVCWLERWTSGVVGTGRAWLNRTRLIRSST